ncbi:hypothetical protein [Paraburkholderia caribensis]|uniref:hypothetical protein n=1 Tax=Paraburkholderia caribensis TaxID=75105 RepID=UPI001CAB4895|nr:hypothetical protein [Paraburkholderia caribensis]CAG9258276.1 conserved exported hypothetical protein [Paraburkholderia caribensis]
MACRVGLLVILTCAASLLSIAAQAQRIHIESGTYGANCGAASGNATRDLAKRCNEHATFRYIVNTRLDATQRAACARDFTAEWSCDHREFHRAMLSAEAGNGSSLILTCVPSTGAGK